MRHRSVLFFALLCIIVFRLPAQQPLSEEGKRRAFLKAREEMTTIPYTPPASPGPKPKPHTTPIGEKPPPHATPAPIVRPTPEPVPQHTPPPVPRSTPPPSPYANIVVRESAVGVPDEEPGPPPKKESFLSRLFGSGGGNYQYLTSSVRRAIDHAPVTRGRWRYIVVHNSGTRQGSAAAFDHYHRVVRKMPNGLAYHFVIGNGTSTKEGAIEIGNRWYRQIQGGHVHSDYLNNIAIGICLVGDFNNSVPRKGQLAALEELINYLRHRVGKIQGHPAEVRAHKNINPPQWPTDCPGNQFPYNWLARKFPEHLR
ncbi:MAG: N-acetylmuramoyl-L-alanine amidase [Chthoniobacteraceae bacterium]